MTIWKFLHIACMFGAVGFVIGGGVYRNAVIRSGDAQAARQVLAIERSTDRIAMPLFLAGLAFGFVTAVTAGFDLTAPWLLLAYVLVALILINGFAVYQPHLDRITAAAHDAGDGTSSELQALAVAPRLRLSSAIDTVLWFAVVFVMVVKPFS